MDIANDNMNNKNLEGTWKKVERDNMKIGLREGLSDGKQENFQVCFNKGYTDGFHNAFLMGKYKGNLKLTDLKNGRLIKEEFLQSSRKGWCTICKDNSLLEKSIEEIQLLQNLSTEELFKDLNLKYEYGCLSLK